MKRGHSNRNSLLGYFAKKTNESTRSDSEKEDQGAEQRKPQTLEESNKTGECSRVDTCTTLMSDLSEKPNHPEVSTIPCKQTKTQKIFYEVHRNQQQEARACLLKLFTSVRFLLRQGLAFRGHVETESNFRQLLQLRAEDDPVLCTYLKRTTAYISPTAQNEMMQAYCHSIQRSIAANMKKDGIFSVMVDGTQDITGKEQESICFRHVDEGLQVHEDFFGLYQLQDTTGEAIANMINDVIIRMGLSIQELRAQTYDGAANMSGKYSGCQAKIKEKQPLALHFHCGSHMANLVMQHSVTSCALVRDAVQAVHELGVLLKRSGKNQKIFFDICEGATSGEKDLPSSTVPIRPLCPTRWLCRFSPINAVVIWYQEVVDCLEEIGQSSRGDVATKANGLLEKFLKGETLLSLMMVLEPIGLLEQLNKSFQARSADISGMMSAVTTTLAQLQSYRSEETFTGIFQKATGKAVEFGLQEISLPRKRQPPKRFSGQATAYQPGCAEEHYRKPYVEFLDSMISGLSTRFQENQGGLNSYGRLEKMLLTGEIDDIIKSYSEVNVSQLPIQLQMFRNTCKYTSLQGAREAYQNMCKEVRALFPEVLILLRLLLVCPVTSCENERSFSTLRRLKTWLRSTMCQERLNFVCICHVHKDLLDKIDVNILAKDFVAESDIRRNIFGKF